MRIYMVRMIETQELVGVYWVTRLSELKECVDEVANPLLVEFTEIHCVGGVKWDGPAPDAVHVDVTKFADDEGGNPLFETIDGASFSEAMWDCLDGAKWLPFTFTDRERFIYGALT